MPKLNLSKRLEINKFKNIELLLHDQSDINDSLFAFLFYVSCHLKLLFVIVSP